MRLELLVRRKGIDPTAETCLHALREIMGLDVDGVEHGTLWRFEFDAGAEAAAVKDAIVRAACRAGRYINTNRDAHVWLDAPEGRAEAGQGQSAADLWICQGDGVDAVARAYFASRLAARLGTVRRGAFYRLWIAAAAPEAVREFALQVAVSRRRRQGLLMNPHAQTLEILQVWSNLVAQRQGT